MLCRIISEYLRDNGYEVQQRVHTIKVSTPSASIYIGRSMVGSGIIDPRSPADIFIYTRTDFGDLKSEFWGRLDFHAPDAFDKLDKILDACGGRQ